MPTTAQLIEAVNGELDELVARHGLSGAPIPKSVTTKQLAERVEGRLRAIVLAGRPQEIPRQQLDEAWIEPEPRIEYLMLFVTVTAPSTAFTPPSNQNPVWNVVPNPVTFVEGSTGQFPGSGTYQSNAYVTDPDGDPLSVSKNSVFVQGVVWDGGKFTFDGTGTAQVVGGHVLTANDGRGGIVPSSQFTITITAPTFGWSSTPSVTYYEGRLADFDLSPYLIGYNQSTDVVSVSPSSPALPAWLTFTGTNNRYLRATGTQVDANDLLTAGTMPVLRVTRGAQVSDSDPIPVTVLPPTVLSTTLTLTSAVGGTLLPFSFGHAFKQADVPPGANVVAEGLSTFQCTPKTYWPDGSLKFGIVAGRATFSAPGASTVVTLTTGTAAGGTALTTSDLQATGVTASISAGAFGSASWSGSDWASPFYAWIAGPQMSSWIYRKQVGADAHLVAWLEVRLWANGAVDVLPWVENGFLTGTTVPNKSDTYTFTLGGTQRFSQVIDVKHRTRVPLLTGSVFSYWLGTDPQITPQHDVAYLQGTKMVPKYGQTNPTAGTLNGLQQTYTPNTLAGVPAEMGMAGQSAALLQNQQALYVTSSGDARAYNATVVLGLSGGSWSIHYRDATTHHLPLFSAYPSASLQGGTPSIPSGTGGTVQDSTPVTTHQPTFGYLPALITGRYWFWEESGFWTTYNYLAQEPARRRGEAQYQGPYYFASGSAAVIDPKTGTYTDRGAAWAMRTLAQTLTLCSSSHPAYSNYVSAWENNTDFYAATFVNGTFSPGWVSPQGFLGAYSSSGFSAYAGGVGGSWWGAAWMQRFQVATWGFTSDIGLPQSSTSLTRHLAIRDHAYKQVVAQAGDGTEWNWRRFALYEYPFGTDQNGLPPNAWNTPAQSYSTYITTQGLAAIPATEGVSLKKHMSDTDIIGDTSDSDSTDWFPFGFAALSYAVDHNAPGAAAGWQRITSASNFNAIAALWNAAPSWGIYPRNPPGLPSWVPAPGTIANVHTNSLAALNPCPTNTCWYSEASKQYGPWEQWTGAVYAPEYSQYGAMIYHGGGHNGYDGTEYYVFDLSTQQWSRTGTLIGDHYPTTPFGGPGGAPTVPEYTNEWNDLYKNGFYIVPALHTYSHCQYWPPQFGGGTKGSYLHTSHVGFYGNKVAPHKIDLVSGLASRVGTTPAAPYYASGAYGGAFLDSNRGIVWATPGQDTSINFRFDLAAGTWTQTSTFLGMGYYGVYCFVPEKDIAIGVSVSTVAPFNISIRGFNLASGVPVSFTVTRNATQACTYGPGIGMDYCPDNGKFYLYEGRAMSTCLTLTPPANWLTGTWTWGSETFTGATPAETPRAALDRYNGAYAPFNRWRYNRALKCFMWSAGPLTGTNYLGQSLPGVFQLWRPQGT